MNPTLSASSDRAATVLFRQFGQFTTLFLEAGQTWMYVAFSRDFKVLGCEQREKLDFSAKNRK